MRVVALGYNGAGSGSHYITGYHGPMIHLNTLERFHIHTEFTANNHLNDDQTIIPNVIFDTLAESKLP